MMVEWKWWNRNFQDKLGSGCQGKRVKAVSLMSGMGNLLVLQSWESLTFSEPGDWLGQAGDYGSRLKTWLR